LSVKKPTLRSRFSAEFTQHRIAIAVEHFICEWGRTSETSRVKIADAVDKRYNETRFGGLTQTINE
jgi:hypothetical protein